MTKKRFTTNGYKIYDTFHDGIHWLVNQVEANEIVDKMNNLDSKARERSKALSKLQKENEQLKQQLKLKEAEERINCRYCIYFILGSSSDSCLKREDIGYKGTCIDGMDYHYLAKNCPYYEKGDVE